MRAKPLLLMALLVLCGAWSGGCDEASSRAPAVEKTKLRVAIAASLQDVMADMREVMQRELVADIEFVPGASSTLAKQIEAGLDADVFISASSEWVDYLEKQALTTRGTRLNVAGNRLVVIAPSNSSSVPTSLRDLKEAAFHPIAIGDPAHVPAGRYARQALEAVGVWNDLKGKTADAPDVRAALAFVTSLQCRVGIVYQTDVAKRLDVRVCFPVDPLLHKPIVYTGVVVNRTKDPETAYRLVGWLTGPRGAEMFRSEGFLPPQ